MPALGNYANQAKIVAAAARFPGNIQAIARAAGVGRATVRRNLKRLGKLPKKPIAGGKRHELKTGKAPLPAGAKVRRYIFTAAQNNTKAHPQFLANLQAFAKHVRAEIHVSRFTYNKNAWGKETVKPGTVGTGDYDDAWYDAALVKYFSDARLPIAHGLVWCGEINILPTAKKPLQGFESYTGRDSCIIPHPRIALASVAAMKGEGTKLTFTTGAVTQRNYIQKRAGLEAEFHHAYGALLVEVDSNGHWYCRHLNATNDGAFYDLDVRVADGAVTTGHRPAAINWGDVHVASADNDVHRLAWGKGGLLDTLRPHHQFMHDLFDMRARGHHDAKNCHSRFARFVNGEDDVAKEVTHTATLLALADRDWCKTVVVDSNHDAHLERWLRDADYKEDHPNALFFLHAQLAKYAAIKGRHDFHLLEWALREADCPPAVKFLREDESFVICKQAGGGVECGMHGHLGPNGARGSLSNLSKLGRKANVGHYHSAGIVDGVYAAGTSSRLRLDYNRGPSSWSHSHVLTYPNGKRAILTVWAGKWRA